jgi:hypothetical protein
VPNLVAAKASLLAAPARLIAGGALAWLLVGALGGGDLVSRAQAASAHRHASPAPSPDSTLLPAGPLTLDPGRGGAGMVIGESTPDAVERVIGTDCLRTGDKSISCMFSTGGNGREKDRRTNRPDGFEFTDGVLSKLVIGKNKTDVFVQGIAVGASKEAVLAALEAPTLVHADTAEIWAYPGRGLALSFIRGTLVGFELSRPASLEVGKFSMKVQPKVGLDGLRLGKTTLSQIERFYGVRYRSKPGGDGFLALIPDDTAEGYWRARFAPAGLKVRRGKVIAMDFKYGVSWASLARGVQFNEETDQVEGLLGRPSKKKAIRGADDASMWTYPKLGLTLTFTLLGLTRITIA